MYFALSIFFSCRKLQKKNVNIFIILNSFFHFLGQWKSYWTMTRGFPRGPFSQNESGSGEKIFDWSQEGARGGEGRPGKVYIYTKRERERLRARYKGKRGSSEYWKFSFGRTPAALEFQIYESSLSIFFFFFRRDPAFSLPSLFHSAQPSRIFIPPTSNPFFFLINIYILSWTSYIDAHVSIK